MVVNRKAFFYLFFEQPEGKKEDYTIKNKIFTELYSYIHAFLHHETINVSIDDKQQPFVVPKEFVLKEHNAGESNQFSRYLYLYFNVNDNVKYDDICLKADVVAKGLINIVKQRLIK